jgi:hypothetical protein
VGEGIGFHDVLEALTPSVPVMQIMVLDFELESKWLKEGRGECGGYERTQAGVAHCFRVDDVDRAYPLRDRNK